MTCTSMIVMSTSGFLKRIKNESIGLWDVLKARLYHYLSTLLVGGRFGLAGSSIADESKG